MLRHTKLQHRPNARAEHEQTEVRVKELWHHARRFRKIAAPARTVVHDRELRLEAKGRAHWTSYDWRPRDARTFGEWRNREKGLLLHCSPRAPVLGGAR